MVSTSALASTVAQGGVNYLLNAIYNTWAIAEHGETSSALAFDVLIDMDVSTENKITQAPVEEGSFAAYNKVVTPTSIALKVAIMEHSWAIAPIKNLYDFVTDTESLEDSIKLLEELADGTTPLDIITPDKIYESFCVTKYAYKRCVEEGRNVIYFDIGFTEVKQVTSQYTNTAIARKKTGGTKQANNESMLSKVLSGF